MTAGVEKFDKATEAGLLMFDTSDNKLYISDISGSGLATSDICFNWIEIKNASD